MTLEELFFNTSVFRVHVGPYSYGELNYCDRLHILITFIYIITPLLTSTHKPVLARAPSSLTNNTNFEFFMETREILEFTIPCIVCYCKKTSSMRLKTLLL